MAETLMIQQLPRHINARSEDLHTRRRYGYVEQGNEDYLDVKTKPRPTRSEDLHKSRRYGHVEADTEERKPSPITSKSECTQAPKRYGYVEKDQTDEIFSRENKKDHTAVQQMQEILDKLLAKIFSRENRRDHLTNNEMPEIRAETLMIQQLPRHINARSEDLHTRKRYGCVEQGNEDYLDVKTKPRTTRSEDLHKSRRYGYVEADTEDYLDVTTEPRSTRSEDLDKSRRYGDAEPDIEERRPSPINSKLEASFEDLFRYWLQARKRYGYVEKDRTAETLLIQQMPRRLNARSENLHERRRYRCVEPANEEFLEVSTGSRPTKSENLHESRRHGFVGTDTEVAEISEVTRRPSPITTRSEGLQDKKRHGYFEQHQTEELPLEPIQYWFYSAEKFPRFHYVYNQTMDCKSRVEKMGTSGIQTHHMPKKVFIKIGIIGESTDNVCNLISKRKGKRTNSEGETIWIAQPLVCFSESWKEDLRLESACHKILIKSNTFSDTYEADDSIIIVGHNKEQIKEAITLCLEAPLYHMLQQWLGIFKSSTSNKSTSRIIAEIEAICKQMVFNNSKDRNVSSLSSSLGTKPIVPDDVKHYLFGRSEVHSFGIWRNSFKILVKKVDEKILKDDLIKMNPYFFEMYGLEVETKTLKDSRSSLKQGDVIKTKIPNNDESYYAGTLGGFVMKVDDESKKYALTCSHLFPQFPYVDEHAYTENWEDIGACIYTTREQACDFAAIEIEESFSDKCDVALEGDDGKKTNAQIYAESLKEIGLVHKRGAKTKVTKGTILSPEWYEKVMDDDNRECLFLVEGINGNFSEEGDSGSLVFFRSKNASQNFVDVVGMVYANKFTVYDSDHNNDDTPNDSGKPKMQSTQAGNKKEKEGKSDIAALDAQDAENISSCFRIHTALKLLKKNQGKHFEVKFKDNLPSSSSSDDSADETCG